MQAEAPPLSAEVRLPCCVLGLRLANAAIAEILFLPPDTPLQPADAPLAEAFRAEIAAYLQDPRHVPQLPLLQRGTPFQQRVWQGIAAIPCGMTRSYGELAAGIGSVPRAVGQACGANPFPIIVPCHRVVARAGLGGFAHQTSDWLLTTKRWLLTHECLR